MAKSRSDACCELCARHTALTFHHLIPRKLHRRPRFQKDFSAEQLNAGLRICYACHRGIHRLYDEMTLAQRLNSRAALLADPAVAKHVAWVARQQVGA